MVPNHEVIRSNRIGDAMTRDSPGERRSAKPPDGFNSRRVSIGPWSSGQGGSFLRSRRAFDSRRAGPWCSRYGRGVMASPRWYHRCAGIASRIYVRPPPPAP